MCTDFQDHSIITSAKEVMFLPVFVCLSVCLCVRKITQKVMDGSLWNFEGMSGMAYIQVVKFWGWSGRNPGFWITVKFSLRLRSFFLYRMQLTRRSHSLAASEAVRWRGHKGAAGKANMDATWRIALPWRRYLQATTAFQFSSNSKKRMPLLIND